MTTLSERADEFESRQMQRPTVFDMMIFLCFDWLGSFRLKRETRLRIEKNYQPVFWALSEENPL